MVLSSHVVLPVSSRKFPRVVHLVVFYNVVKFRSPNCNTFRDMNYCPVSIIVQSEIGQVRTDKRTDRRTESDAYEPTVQSARVGSKMLAYMCWGEG